MGTVANPLNREGTVGKASAWRVGSINNAVTDTASACTSFAECGGTEAGDDGAPSSADLQHEGVTQPLESQPVPQHDFAPVTFEKALTAKTPGHARITPSTNTTASFANL